MDVRRGGDGQQVWVKGLVCIGVYIHMCALWRYSLKPHLGDDVGETGPESHLAEQNIPERHDGVVVSARVLGPAEQEREERDGRAHGLCAACVCVVGGDSGGCCV